MPHDSVAPHWGQVFRAGFVRGMPAGGVCADFRVVVSFVRLGRAALAGGALVVGFIGTARERAWGRL